MPRWRFCGDRLKRMGCYVEIDGSYGEGGGQILRTSLSLAALTGQALCLTHIRAARPKPGLAAQHLTAARAVATVCGGQLQGDAFGSQELKLVPGAVRAGPYEFNVAEERGSAGSVGLVLQSVLPPLLVGVGSVEVAVHGGTNVPWSPCFEYLAHVFGPCLALLGAEVVFERLRAGFYPHGGGTIVARGTLKRRLEALVLDEAPVLNEVVIAGVVSDRLPAHIGPRQVESCRRQLAEALPQGVGVKEIDERVPSGGPGTCILAAASATCGFAGFSAIGERGKPAETVGAEAGRELPDFLATHTHLDQRLSDQMLLYAALAEGPSTWTTPEITRHFRTNAHVVRRFLPVGIAWKEETTERWRVTVTPQPAPA